jgi:NAD(P)-dependent dehydrogenase (short-subunit alcohol dehydrogenase family)
MSFLKGKTIVVTGGGGVLCSAMAEGLAAVGARISILNRTLEKGERVAARIRAAGGQATAIACNVLSSESLQKAKIESEAVFGPCDILINGAGGNDPRGTTSKEYWSAWAADGAPDADAATPAGSFFAMEEAGFRAVFDLNFLGTFLAIQTFARDMIGRPGASILNVSSMSAFAPLTKIPAYSAAKAAVNNFTSWLGVHFAESGLRVNAIAPGFFLTEQNRALLLKEDGSPSDRTKKILAATPMRRLGVAADLVGPTLWICDASVSGFVTGTVIPVDGGFQAYSGV